MSLAITPTNLSSGGVKQNNSPTSNIVGGVPGGAVIPSTVINSVRSFFSSPNTGNSTSNTSKAQKSNTNIPAAPGSPVSTSGATTDPAAASYYGNVVTQLQALLNALPTQQQQGIDNIGNSADKSLGEANTSEGQALSSIAGQRQTANQNKESSINSIDQNVADTISSFGRLLGGAHAGDSAFAHDFVPLATSKEGSTQAQGVYNDYGQDMSGLDTAQKNAETQYDQNVSDINDKKNNDILSFISGLQDQRDSLNQQAAQAAYYKQEAAGGNGASTEAAIAPFNTDTQSRITALNNLFSTYANPTYAVNPVNVTLPDLSSYTQNPLVAKLSASNPDTSLAYLPFLPQIKKQTSASTTGTPTTSS